MPIGIPVLAIFEWLDVQALKMSDNDVASALNIRNIKIISGRFGRNEKQA